MASDVVLNPCWAHIADFWVSGYIDKCSICSDSLIIRGEKLVGYSGPHSQTYRSGGVKGLEHEPTNFGDRAGSYVDVLKAGKRT